MTTKQTKRMKTSDRILRGFALVDGKQQFRANFAYSSPDFTKPIRACVNGCYLLNADGTPGFCSIPEKKFMEFAPST
jgi:hypothetical protein